MRELKFRAWDHERSVMVHGQDIEEYEDELDEVSYTYHAPRYQTGLSYGKLFVAYTSKSGDFTECEVMQFTGLLDKNGKEIYEGDVVRVPDGYSGDHYYTAINGYVVYEPPDFVITAPANIQGVVMQDFGWESLEVIGNIHEHPHLLRS